MQQFSCRPRRLIKNQVGIIPPPAATTTVSHKFPHTPLPTFKSIKSTNPQSSSPLNDFPSPQLSRCYLDCTSASGGEPSFCSDSDSPSTPTRPQRRSHFIHFTSQADIGSDSEQEEEHQLPPHSKFKKNHHYYNFVDEKSTNYRNTDDFSRDYTFTQAPSPQLALSSSPQFSNSLDDQLVIVQLPSPLSLTPSTTTTPTTTTTTIPTISDVHGGVAPYTLIKINNTDNYPINNLLNIQINPQINSLPKQTTLITPHTTPLTTFPRRLSGIFDLVPGQFLPLPLQQEQEPTIVPPLPFIFSEDHHPQQPHDSWICHTSLFPDFQTSPLDFNTIPFDHYPTNPFLSSTLYAQINSSPTQMADMSDTVDKNNHVDSPPDQQQQANESSPHDSSEDQQHSELLPPVDFVKRLQRVATEETREDDLKKLYRAHQNVLENPTDPHSFRQFIHYVSVLTTSPLFYNLQELDLCTFSSETQLTGLILPLNPVEIQHRFGTPHSPKSTINAIFNNIVQFYSPDDMVSFPGFEKSTETFGLRIDFSTYIPNEDSRFVYLARTTHHNPHGFTSNQISNIQKAFESKTRLIWGARSLVHKLLTERFSPKGKEMSPKDLILLQRWLHSRLPDCGPVGNPTKNFQPAKYLNIERLAYTNGSTVHIDHNDTDNHQKICLKGKCDGRTCTVGSHVPVLEGSIDNCVLSVTGAGTKRQTYVYATIHPFDLDLEMLDLEM